MARKTKQTHGSYILVLRQDKGNSRNHGLADPNVSVLFLALRGLSLYLQLPPPPLLCSTQLDSTPLHSALLHSTIPYHTLPYHTILYHTIVYYASTGAAGP